ncbi:MAG: Stp1/IreP family PP2C-type Ser/Thr phosphatase [Tissierellia bacterium]|nr:Stp1/IreP family PP2C-type Ser/Thr phosphatase [Tissierellia bacterium]
MEYIGLTDKGPVRSINQDTFRIIEGLDYTIFMVADGMGGHSGGEVASMMACETIEAHIKKEENVGIHTILDGVRLSNENILKRGKEDKSLKGMGTTLVLLFQGKEGFHFINIGDSRLYGSTKGKLVQLSVDDSYVNMLVKSGGISKEEAQRHPQRSMITKALGTDKNLIVNSACIEEEYEQFLLCSDGLTSMVDDDTINSIIAGNEPVKYRVESMLQKAIETGGHDNITVILIDRRETGENND